MILYKNFFAEFKLMTTAMADCLGMDAELFYTKTRKREVVIPRQVLMTVFKFRYPQLNLHTIGGFFNRDHATVIHAMKQVYDGLFTKDKIMRDCCSWALEISKQIPRKQLHQKKLLILKFNSR